MLNKTFYRFTLAAAFSLVSLSANAVTYTFTHLATPSGMRSSAIDINNSGQVVGMTMTDSTPYAMLWDNGVTTQLDTGGSWAKSINNFGKIAGDGPDGRATLWDNGVANYLGSPGVASMANSINDSGKVVGLDQYSGTGRAALWSNGGVADLGTLGTGLNSEASSINDLGQIVGWSTADGFSGYTATLWDNGIPTNLGRLGTGLSSRALSINDLGQIVGWSTTDGFSGTTATLWDNGIPTNLGRLGNADTDFSQAHSINNSGQIVGITYLSGGGGKATLWSNGNIIDLNTLLSASDVAAGWTLTNANAINDNGYIVGDARNNLLGIRTGAFLMSINPVPEVDTSAMLLMGAGLMGFIARRRKNTQA